MRAELLNIERQREERQREERIGKERRQEVRRMRAELLNIERQRAERKENRQEMIREMQKQLDEDVWDVNGSLTSRANIGKKIVSAGIPKSFICPISFNIMKDPVIASDGFTYDRTSITTYFQRNQTGVSPRSPLSGVDLPNLNLVPNLALRDAINHLFGNDKAAGDLGLEEEDFNF